jgi:hypothetical protein
MKSWPFFREASGAQAMTLNKFAVGQLVDFDTRIEPTPRTKGPYQVLRVLPTDDAMQPRVYRIKSQAEPFERNASEYEIVAAPAPTAAPAAQPAKRNPKASPKAGPLHRAPMGR